MSRQGGIYVQGAYLTRNDFEPTKTIKYFSELFGIALTNKMLEEIKTDTLSDDTLNYLEVNLNIKMPVSCAQDICNAILTYEELLDLFADIDENGIICNKMVVGDIFKNIQGNFEPSNPDKPIESIEGEYMMLGFCIPFVWDIKANEIPTNKAEAIYQLMDVGKKLLKDDIDWEERLGALKASYVETYL